MHRNKIDGSRTEHGHLWISKKPPAQLIPICPISTPNTNQDAWIMSCPMVQRTGSGGSATSMGSQWSPGCQTQWWGATTWAIQKSTAGSVVVCGTYTTWFIEIITYYPDTYSSSIYQKRCNLDWIGQFPSGKLTFCYGKSPFSMGKSTISMAMASIAM